MDEGLRGKKRAEEGCTRRREQVRRRPLASTQWRLCEWRKARFNEPHGVRGLLGAAHGQVVEPPRRSSPGGSVRPRLGSTAAGAVWDPGPLAPQMQGVHCSTRYLSKSSNFDRIVKRSLNLWHYNYSAKLRASHSVWRTGSARPGGWQMST
jgi:hypothetical protein